MLNIHLRGQEVPACNAGEWLGTLVPPNFISTLHIILEGLHAMLLQMKQMMHTA